jgi:NADH:ubiquinone oxidoreductase subunit F (NADH-binding)/NADH:ubiquinone oxidoreductase subunit E
MSLKSKYNPIDPAIQNLANQYHNQPKAVLEIFQQIQKLNGGLTKSEIVDTARALQISASKAYGVASFYSMLHLTPRSGGVVRVCDGPVCWLNHSKKVQEGLEKAVTGQGDWSVERTSCLGLCDHAPAALVNLNQVGPVSVQHPEDILNGNFDVPHTYIHPRHGEIRVMLARSADINPDSLDSAVDNGAYQALKKALHTLPEELIKLVESSGVTGRGGAGFPVGRKWRFVAQADKKPKYVICNADESEPLIFKDRVLIDSNPHQIIEGMIIAGFATGASAGYIYIRGEYNSQADRLERAVHQANAENLLGKSILGTNFDFQIHVHRGAGAYICGEETALIESIEGSRGEPRFRPPYPPTYGLWGNPTLVNNVESYAAIPSIIDRGPEWYRNLSGYPTPGTKLYMILGHVQKQGLFEAPFGITLRQAIEDFGGGMLPGSSFNFALTGGAAGTVVSSQFLDIPLDYASSSKGISLGAGALLVCDQTISPVAFLRELLHFFTAESCGKCTPCREGTHQSLIILNRLAGGRGANGDIAQLERLAEVLQLASFCGLGQSVAIPVKTALLNFRAEFIAAETGDSSS